jgi:hypothetical protein
LTYNTTIEPKRVADSLSALVSTIAHEFREDLSLIDGPLVQEARRAAASNLDREREPGVADKVYMEAARNRADESTPLRARSFDLLHRVCTILAIKSLQDELLQASTKSDGPKSASMSYRTLGYLDDYCAGWWPRLTGVVVWKHKTMVSDHFLDELSRRPPVLRPDAVLIDPPRIAQMIEDHRVKVVNVLTRKLSPEKVTDTLTSFQREALERAALEASWSREIVEE